METYEFMKICGERNNRVNQIYSAWAKSRGVNYNILAVLYTAYKNENCSQKFICEEWCIPKQTVNTTCKELIAANIITQGQNTEDKRESCVRLTENGKAFATPIVSELLDIESRVLSRMGSKAVSQFLHLFKHYTENIEIEFANSFTLLGDYLTKANKKKVVRTETTNWLVPVNPKYYDIEKAFNENNTILWKQSSSVIVGDTIYLYIAAPYSCVLYKCKAVEVDIPYEYADKNVRMQKVMKIQRLHTYDKTMFGLNELKEHGILSVRGPRSIPYGLRYKLEKESENGT